MKTKKPATEMQSQLLEVSQESTLTQNLRRTIAWNLVRSTIHTSRFRFGLVLLLSGIFWAAVFCLFYESFVFIDSMHAEVMSLLFNTFFSALMIMMIFSTGILMYGGLYRSAESKFLLTCPLRAEAIHSHKFIEALWFSSWGFILLGSPMLIAYGIVRNAPWSFFAMLLPFMVAFVFYSSLTRQHIVHACCCRPTSTATACLFSLICGRNVHRYMAGLVNFQLNTKPSSHTCMV